MKCSVAIAALLSLTLFSVAAIEAANLIMEFQNGKPCTSLQYFLFNIECVSRKLLNHRVLQIA